MKAAFRADRGVVKVAGEGARDFLNGLITTDAVLLRPGTSLSPEDAAQAVAEGVTIANYDGASLKKTTVCGSYGGRSSSSPGSSTGLSATTA